MQVTRINCYADLLRLILVLATDSTIKHPVTSGKNYGMCVLYMHCKFQKFLKQKVVERNLIFLGQLAVILHNVFICIGSGFAECRKLCI